MTRLSTLGFFAWISVFGLGNQVIAAFPGIINQQVAAAHGLTRAWYSQIEMDSGSGRVAHMVLAGDTLFVQTDNAVLHALGAETGRTLWVQRVGSASHPTMPAAAKGDYVAVINGSTLYVLNRFNGDLLWKKQVEHVPGAGAALSDRYVYVPMVNGLVVAYRLRPADDPVAKLRQEQNVELTAEERESAEVERISGVRISQETIPPLVCTSYGQVLVPPLVTSEGELTENVAWTTSRGYLFVGQLDSEGERFAPQYRLATNGPITSQPAYLPVDANVAGDSAVIYGASEDGFVYALRESDGQLLWRFSTGEPIIEQTVVIGFQVFVPTQTGAMYCLDAKTGKELWSASGIRRFLCASKDRIYVADKIGRVIVLNAKAGTRLDTLQLSSLPVQMTNQQNDRLYVASPTGLVQSLHEIGLPQPVPHRQLVVAEQKKEAGAKEVEAKQAEQPAADSPFGAPQNQDEDNPFGGGAMQQPDANPFGAAAPAENNPFGAAPAGDNPFN